MSTPSCCISAQIATSASTPSAAFPSNSAVVRPDLVVAPILEQLDLELVYFEPFHFGFLAFAHLVLHYRLPSTIDGSGAAMNNNMIGARIAIVGTSIAARRRTASLWSCSRRASRMSSLRASSDDTEIGPRSALAASN